MRVVDALGDRDGVERGQQDDGRGEQAEAEAEQYDALGEGMLLPRASYAFACFSPAASASLVRTSWLRLTPSRRAISTSVMCRDFGMRVTNFPL